MDTSAVSRAVRTSRWPVLGAALTTAVSGGLVALVPTLDGSLAFWVSVAGYVLGAVVVMVLVQVHRAARNRASSSPWFNPTPAFDRLAAAAMVLGLLVGGWHALLVATELAK